MAVCSNEVLAEYLLETMETLRFFMLSHIKLIKVPYSGGRHFVELKKLGYFFILH